jgi:hypothetical protein
MTSGPLQMPPAHANKPLSDAQRQILKRWIAEGAVYKAHWAFVPPKQIALPAVKNKAWPRNPIDYFVLARLEKEGLKPAEADRYTLVRRVTLDLIGLPPTPEEADAFVNDNLRTPTRNWWIDSSPRRTTESDGRGAGSTSPATPTPTATRKTASAPSGPTATGSSTR